MFQKVIALVLVLSSGAAVHAAIPGTENTKSCIMYYVKNSVAVPNLVVACDGNTVISGYAKMESEVSDPAQLKADLYASFQAMINVDGQKTCLTYETADLWWTSCYVK